MCLLLSVHACTGFVGPHTSQVLEGPALVDIHLPFCAHTPLSCSHVFMLEAPLLGNE